jgi:hypothetical protein
MPGYPSKPNTVHERVAFGEKTSKADRRIGAGSHRSGTVSRQLPEDVALSSARESRKAVRPRPDVIHHEKPGIVHERVAFGEKVSRVERRSAAGSHRSGTLTEYARERVDAIKTRQGRNVVRPRRGLNIDPGAKEY